MILVATLSTECVPILLRPKLFQNAMQPLQSLEPFFSCLDLLIVIFDRMSPPNRGGFKIFLSLYDFVGR